MERAAGLVFPAGFFQRDAVINDLDNIGSGQQFIDELVWYAPHGLKGPV
jgi:hypothetical protein